METVGKRLAQCCLGDAIDASGITRTEIAERGEIGEAQLSKLTHAAAIDMLDWLPDAVIVGFVVRYGRARGCFEAREVLPAEVNAEIMALVDRLALLQRLRDVQLRPAKANLSEPVETRRRA